MLVNYRFSSPYLRILILSGMNILYLNERPKMLPTPLHAFESDNVEKYGKYANAVTFNFFAT